MKKDLINMEYWREAHLLPLLCPTDAFYVKYARKVRDRIRKADFEWKMSAEDMTEIALTLTYYFEDVVSGLGVWRAFIDEHKRLYGRYLPFYDVEEERYFPDEVNEQDVLCLIWMTFQKRNAGVIVNPENPYMKQLAHEVFELFDEDFEHVPINEDLLTAMKNPVLYQDFYNLKALMVQVCCMSYLFYYFTAQHRQRVLQQVEHIVGRGSAPSVLAYFSESILGVEEKTGPLAQEPCLWLSRMLASWGMKQESEWLKEMQTKELQPYLIVESDGDKVVLEDVNEQRYELLLCHLTDVNSDTVRKQKVLLGSLVSYRGNWFLNGGGSWLPVDTKFLQYKEQYQTQKKQNLRIYNKVTKVLQGESMLFFADNEALNLWMKENLKRIVTATTMQDVANEHQDEKNLAVFVSPEKGIVVLPEGATCICHPNNPFYQAGQTADAVRILFDMNYATPEMVRYLVDHNLLPDAALASDNGLEYGQKLLQNNLDFLLRVIRSDF